MISETNNEVKMLNGELEGLREAIRNTFEDDLLQTSNVGGGQQPQQRQSQFK